MYLGLDPSSTATGIAVLDRAGDIVLTSKFKMTPNDPRSFHNLYEEIQRVVETYGVEYVGCEDQYGGPDVLALIKQVRSTGSILAALGNNERTHFELDKNLFLFMPASWRKMFQGQGKKHTKKSTYLYVTEVLGVPMKSFTADNDRADAIGIAYATKMKAEEESA